MKLNEKIETRRKELNLTLDDIAKQTGVSKQTVGAWASGKIKDIGISKINQLARILKVDPITLIVDEKELVEMEYKEPIPALAPFDKQLLDLMLKLNSNEKIELYNMLISKVGNR